MKKYLNIIFLNIGFTAGIAQVLFLREFLSIFQGNEITVGVVLIWWLFWTATGSFFAGKLTGSKTKIEKYFVFVILLVTVSLPLTILAIRLTIAAVKPVPGFTPGLGPIIIFTFFTLSGFCFFSGASFAVTSKFMKGYQKLSVRLAAGKLYALESFGAALAGIILSVLLIDRFDGLTLALFSSILNGILIFIFYLKQVYFKNILGPIAAGLVLYLGLIISIINLGKLSTEYQWQSLHLIENFESRYGKLSLIDGETGKTIYNNSVPLFTYPDRETAEESVHFALLQHPNPGNVLIIGNGLSGALEEILKYSSVTRIDYVELDPKILQISKEYFPEAFIKISKNKHIYFHILDGRRFLARTQTIYDVIILNVPEPNSIQYNRYYSSEFYQLAESKLSDTGILTFQLNGSENYINDKQAVFFKCVYATLVSVFPGVSAYPGETVHFFGCKSKEILTNDINILVARIRARNLELQYIREYYLPFRLSPERIEYLQRNVTPDKRTRVNSDYHPILCFYNLIFWNQQYTDIFAQTMQFLSTQGQSGLIVFGVFLFIILILLFKIPGSEKSLEQLTATISIFVSGFSLLGLEVLALLIFQAEMGYMYHQIAVLLAAFMAGLGIGATLAIKYHTKISGTRGQTARSLFFTHFFLLIMPFIFVFLFPSANYWGLSELLEVILLMCFIFLLFLAGTAGGILFPVAGKIYYHSSNMNTGSLYAIDLLGALAGALIINIIIIPFYGFYKAAWLISIIQLSVIVLSIRIMSK